MKSRIAALESARSNIIPASTSAPLCPHFLSKPGIEKKLIRKSINSVEKHLRRHNVIVRDLGADSHNALDKVSHFIKDNFKLSNCVTNALVIGKNVNKIKATLNSHLSKVAIMNKKATSGFQSLLIAILHQSRIG